MASVLKQRVTLVCILLVLATIVSWFLGSHEGGELTTFAVMVIAFIKVRMVIFNFMEVRDAPLALRLLCDAWLLGTAVSLILVYQLH